jgi:hypothetical protein
MNDRAAGARRRHNPDPIAHGRKVGSPASLVAKASADLRPAVEFTRNTVQPALFLHDPGDLQCRAFVANLFLKERRPAEVYQ